MNDTLLLTAETIEAYQELVTNPAKYGLTITPLPDFFEPAAEVTANHVLFQQYVDAINRQLPKVIFYIVMENLYGPPNGKDGQGNLGYKLKAK